MKRLILIAILLAAVAGCGQLSVNEAKKDAYQRWYHARAGVLYGVACEHLKVGQLDEAARKASEALALDEDYHEAQLLLGKIHIEQGHYGVAVVDLTKAHEQMPGSPEALYLLGVAQEKSGRLEDALKSYRRSHALDSSNLSAVTAAAEVLVGMNRIREAQLYIESYTGVAGEDVGVFELAGRLAMMRKEYDKAAEYYQQACDLDYKNVMYKESLGRAQFLAGQHRQAVEVLEDLAGSVDYVASAWVYLMLGDSCMSLGRPTKARDAYYKATELSPSNSPAWSGLAKAALAMKDIHRAILSARQALDLDANFLDATLVLGYALLEDGQVAGAAGLLSRAIAAHPNSSMLYSLLGRAQVAQGNEAQAMRCYVEALRIEPGNELARTLLSGLNARQLSKVE